MRSHVENALKAGVEDDELLAVLELGVERIKYLSDTVKEFDDLQRTFGFCCHTNDQDYMCGYAREVHDSYIDGEHSFMSLWEFVAMKRAINHAMAQAEGTNA